MSPAEFFYWLKGYLELHGETIAFTQAQAECISRRVDDVMKWLGEGKRGGGAHPDTIAALFEIRTLASLFHVGRSDDVKREFTKLIIDRVNERFGKD
jgi:hypothetical protein